MSRGPVDSDDPSDEALLAGMAHGDESAVVTFVRRYQRRVFGLAHAMLGDAGAAEDVAQEALTRVWRHAPVFDARRGSVATWVLTITRNLAIDSLRVRRSLTMSADELTDLPQLDLRPDPLAAVDTTTEVRRALAALPLEQRRAITLAALYGYTAAEVAQAEQIPLGTAKTRIRSALMKLRDSFVATGDLP
ncbi:MAG TPA: sigma-70 family RNA polymerase sigma factor [Acidimicrobiales bacterium]|nr:sigma-70 family RNA polymerase sigma factor [Acidimicrobiales bacterium]